MNVDSQISIPTRLMKLIEIESENSVKIEGYTINDPQYLNYVETAEFIYTIGYENYFTNDFIFNISLIRQINNGVVFHGGDYRNTNIKISGAKISPPQFYFISEWMKLYVDFVNRNYNNMNNDFIEFISKQHVLFESIHPFSDGNGRTGRIINNYLLLSKMNKLSIIRGNLENRRMYINSFEKCDYVLNELFLGFPDKNKLDKVMKDIDVSDMRDLISSSLVEIGG